MLDMLSNLSNIALILLGFGLVIFIHEMGHFLAARWAGVRVHAFAIGFGPALFSWRKGMGVRRGSSEPEYMEALKREREGLNPDDPHAISPTEYRLNAFPFGGYVKMLGQEDLNPEATSAEPDSYMNKPVWKRMVIISAGVVMNLILAAVLYVIVFMAGLKAAAPIVGGVVAGSAAEEAGLRAGDVVLTIEGQPAETFADVMIATAMSSAGTPIELTVRRAGEPEPITLSATPTVDEATDLLDLGVFAAPGDRIGTLFPGVSEEAVRAAFDRIGLVGVEPGARLVAVNGEAIGQGGGVPSALAVDRAARSSDGRPVTLTFAQGGAGQEVSVTVEPRARLQVLSALVGETEWDVWHILGLAPPMGVASVREAGADAGLRAGDVFARIGGVAWPTIPEGVREIRAHSSGTVDLTLLRDGELVELTAPVDGDGLIGFAPEPAVSTTIVGGVPSSVRDRDDAPAALRAFPLPLAGSRITSVNGAPVKSFTDVRNAVQSALRASPGAPIEVTLTPPIDGAEAETLVLEPRAREREAVLALGWEAPGLTAAFEPASVVLKAGDPFTALFMGVRETKRKVVLTYLTIQRLIEGSVKVKHLKGPVGITHIGAQMADQGFIYLLFFLALISANLAVINFLPLPIVDGGMFLMLCYEGVFRRPVPIGVQNALTLIGLVLIGAMFLTVTYYDLRGLIG